LLLKAGPRGLDELHQLADKLVGLIKLVSMLNIT
jgi:hypothetical protein